MEGEKEKVHPFSVPLRKDESTAHGGTTDEGESKKERQVKVISFWKIFFAMVLFPFLFHAGTELYMLGRAAILTNIAPKPEAQKTSTPPALSDQKTLEALTSILVNQQKLLEEGGKVVVIQPPYPGGWSFETEKTRIYELTGINMDDPIIGSNKIAKLKSVELLRLLMESFDRIVLGAAQYNISDFHVKNALEGKKQSLKRLQEIR